MIRAFLLLFAATMLAARASAAIHAPVQGGSVPITQTHVIAELIPEVTTVTAGKPFDIILHLHMDPNWHTYWINPGDAGLATTIKWTLPAGFTAGPIQWPTPEKHNMGPLVTYGYDGDVYLLTTITPPQGDLPQHFDIKATAAWLVCQEECIPGKADLTLTLDSGMLNLRLPVDNTDFFAQARERLPVANTRWNVKASYGQRGDFNIRPAPEAVNVELHERVKGASDKFQARFYPEQPNVLGTQPSDQSPFYPMWPDGTGIEFSISLQQNGDKPNKLSGVLVSDQSLIGNTQSVYIAEFPISKVAAAVPSSGSVNPPPTAPPLGTAAATSEAGGGQNGASSTSAPAAQRAAATGSPAQSTAATSAPAASQLLIAVLGAAFVGGLILNLMPCVLPVLSLKVFSLMKHAGENPRAAWVQGVAFTAGVVVSFWVLAGLLLGLRAAGNHLGWGFQMQSPGFVLALILLFFLLALNLFGVFELGTSLVGLDAKTSGKFSGLAGSFGNGALATLAATPCTAPFMGSSLGFAAQQPPFVALLIFTFLALGMAAPYLLLTIFPGALKFVPKPGAWMESLKQFMGFLLMATVIFLVYVFSALAGEAQAPWLLGVLLMAGLAAWIYGRWSSPLHSAPVRVAAFVFALAFLAGAIGWGATLAQAAPENSAAQRAAATDGGWQPWSPDAVNAALDQGRPVFVDFTAAWCLSCKVNERVALDTDAVKQAFAQKNVALFRADWTHSDPAISKTLQQFNRDGVPLYLLYSPQAKDTPQVLPEVLTPGIVLEALKKI